ncbi:hypothetical protein ACIQTU_07000 [Brevundimonas sp. NPDC090276]|uniref:hypothetical protein n=1 Tax=Brevundimonas sp. NPDC090276 TaxID=3363956 RepID=UPI00383BB9BF
MDRTEVIAGVASELYATEKAVDDAITHATSLVQAMIGARTALSLSPVSAAGSQAKAIEAIMALGAAREAVVACHAEMQKDHRRLGYGTYAVGPLNKPDEWDDRPMIRKDAHLRVA